MNHINPSRPSRSPILRGVLPLFQMCGLVKLWRAHRIFRSLPGICQGLVSLRSSGDARPQDNQGWLRPEFEGASVDDGPENIAGCQNADRVTGAVEDCNRIHVFIEHHAGDLADLRRRGGGQDPAAHHTGEFVPGGRSRRIDGFQLMRIGQQFLVRYHSDQRAMDRSHREMVNPLHFITVHVPSSVLLDGNHVTGEVIKSCARSTGFGAGAWCSCCW